MSLTIFDPTDGPFRQTEMAPRTFSLHGAKVGVIWNGRPHGDKVLRAIVRRLSEGTGCEIVEVLKKPFIGNVAPEDFFEKLQRRQVDFVLAGVGD